MCADPSSHALHASPKAHQGYGLISEAKTLPGHPFATRTQQLASRGEQKQQEIPFQHNQAVGFHAHLAWQGTTQQAGEQLAACFPGQLTKAVPPTVQYVSFCLHLFPQKQRGASR